MRCEFASLLSAARFAISLPPRSLRSTSVNLFSVKRRKQNWAITHRHIRPESKHDLPQCSVVLAVPPLRGVARRNLPAPRAHRNRRSALPLSLRRGPRGSMKIGPEQYRIRVGQWGSDTGDDFGSFSLMGPCNASGADFAMEVKQRRNKCQRTTKRVPARVRM